MSKPLLWSLGGHVLLVVVFTLQAVFWSGQPLVLTDSIRVDLVALPDKLPPNAVAQPQTAPPDVKPVQTPKATPKPVEKTDAINLDKSSKKKETDALEKLKQNIETEKIQKSAQTFKGNQLSSGSELKGLAALQHDKYLAQVKRQIYTHWALPEWLSRRNLKAQIVVRVDSQGNVVGQKIYRSSGDPDFDAMVMETVKKSSPVSAPPDELAKILNNEGVLIGFPE